MSSSGFDTSDFNKLSQKIQDLGNVGKKIAKESLLDSAEIVLKQQKQDAPKAKSNSTKGYSGLSIDKKIKTYKGGSSYVKIGITSENWETLKHLYFHHFGYENKGRGNRYKGMYISKHAGWMNKSFDKCKDKAKLRLYENIKSKIKF